MAWDTNRQEGDKLSAQDWNQIVQEVKSKQSRLNIVDALDSTSSVDVLSAKQGKVLDEKITSANTAISGISNKVDKLPTGVYYGQYNSEEDLGNVQVTTKGYAYIASTDPAVYYIYLYDNGTWTNSGNKFVTTNLETDLSTKSETKAPTTKVVAEGIKAIDVTTEQEFTSTQKETARTNINAQENIVSMADKLPVVAALNNRAADINQQTSEVKALGYKVLNPALRFAEQVENVVENDVVVTDNSNTIFEIRDEFDLNGDSVTIPANCTLKFNGGSVKNGTINGNATLIIATEAFDETITFTGSFQNDTVSSSFFKKTIIDFTYVVGSLMTIVKDGGKIIIERDLTAAANDTTLICLTITRDLYIDFQNYTITLQARDAATASSACYLFYSKPQVACKVRIENAIINATANIEQTGDFSGMTSWWSLVYLQNNVGIAVNNIKFHNAANVIKCSRESANDMLENITITNCDLHGKMLVQIYGCKNVSINNCVFDGSLATNNYDHALYITGTTNLKAENNVFKNYRDAINVYNSATGTVRGDEKSILFSGCTVDSCGRFMALGKTVGAVLENIYITNLSGFSVPLWIDNCQSVKVHGLSVVDTTLTTSNNTISVSSSNNICFEQIYVKMKSFKLYFVTSEQILISNSSFIASDAIPSGERAIYSTSSIYVNNSTFDFGGVTATAEPIHSASSKTIFNNCIFKDLKTTSHLLCQYTTGENVELHNCKLTNISAYYTDVGTGYSFPTVDNCTRNGSFFSDFPAKKSGPSTWRNKSIVTDRLVAGFTFFDTTINKLIVWTGSIWVDSNGEPIGLNVSDTSVLIGATADSATINVYHVNALNVTALNPDNTPATWLTVPSNIAVGTNTLTISAAANTASNPRGAKVIISDDTDVVIVNVVQNYSTT